MNTKASFSRRAMVGYQLGFISFSRLSNILRLTRYLIEVHPRYIMRAFLIGVSSVCSTPLRLLEKVFFGRRIAAVQIDKPPVFIIGHWRSGTTYLHNLISQDSTFGFVSMYQAMLPECSLIGGYWLKDLMSRVVPLKRPMDNMIWPMDAPQEEEIPLAKMLPYSFYTQFIFPHRTKHFFNKYVLLEGASGRLIAEFKRKYYQLLQIATLHAGGKQLVLKNPVNTARVRLLLELFPDAKFIHIHRSPYDVCASAKNLYHKIHVFTALQTIDPKNADETVLFLYATMMQRFFKEKTLIPSNNYAEVRFEDLERKPLEELRRIYETLQLPGFSAAEPALSRYIDSQKSYRKNRFELSVEYRKQIEKRLGFVFSKLGYKHNDACHSVRMTSKPSASS